MTDNAGDHDLATMSDNRTLSAIRPEGCDPLESTSALLDATVATYLGAAHTNNTRRAYASDIAHFRGWGGSIPSSPDEVARYLAAHAGTLNTRTLRRRVAALAQAHAGQADPTKTVLVTRLLRGIARRHERPPRQATPLLLDDLRRIVATLGQDSADLRDQALLLIGFFAALRRSELVALDVGDVAKGDRRLFLTVRHSKTDQTGRGRCIAVRYRDDELCPARALQRWCEYSRICEGALFRRITTEQRLCDRTVARVIQRRASDAGLNARFSGHSLRAGFVTTAVIAGLDLPSIAHQTGHRSLPALATYVRPPFGTRASALNLAR
jgi:integrase